MFCVNKSLITPIILSQVCKIQTAVLPRWVNTMSYISQHDLGEHVANIMKSTICESNLIDINLENLISTSAELVYSLFSDE